VRIRRLLLVLALILLGGSTPLYAALGDAPRCYPAVTAQGTTALDDANPPISNLRLAVPNYDPEERDYLIRTIAFEASGEPEEGKAAVAHVILNRKRTGRWGDNIKDVVTHPWQFEPWMTRRKDMERLSPEDPRYQNAAQIADAVLTGQRPDPTAGATHFLNPTIVRQRRGGSLPSWARGAGQPIGRHTFYSPDEGDAAPQRAALSFFMLTRSGEALPLQARGNILATGRVDGACGRRALTARSPNLPVGDLVRLDAK
jgi:spore germination cell wall hydrolase CwlJ-like protein